MPWEFVLEGWRNRPRKPLRPPKPPVNQETTTSLIPALNAERTKVGLSQLVESSSLNQEALDWAKHMAVTKVLTHGDFVGRMSAVVPGHACGENIAAGQSSVPEVVGDWMDSPGHKANILGSQYQMAGHGEAADVDGVTYWCVDFAS